MSIQIIKPGVVKGPQRYRATCSKCECEFTFIATDARWSTDEREPSLLIVKCPTPLCGEQIYRDASDARV